MEQWQIFRSKKNFLLRNRQKGGRAAERLYLLRVSGAGVLTGNRWRELCFLKETWSLHEMESIPGGGGCDIL